MPDRPRLKICGVTNVEDARLVGACGADYCGILVDVGFSERGVPLRQAREVASASRIPVVLLLCILHAGVPGAEPGIAWSTFLGGEDNDKANAMAVDDSGNVYLIGSTRSLEFPATPGAFDTSYGDKTDAFVARIDAGGGGLAYATYLGGSGGDRGYDIDVDASGSAYVTGFTYSGNFPVTAGAFDTEHNSPGGLYQDVFVSRLNPNGGALIYSTFIGGSQGEGGYALSLCQDGSVIVAGDTQSPDFPITPQAYDTTHGGSKDVFVARLDASGSALEFATFAGGSSVENFETIVQDDAGGIYVVGETQSDDLPTTGNAFDNTYNLNADAFVFKLSAAGDSLEASCGLLVSVEALYLPKNRSGVLWASAL